MFITLEGIEGSGKTTQLPNIARYLESKGGRCTITREPGGTAIGTQIRSILLNPDSRGMEPPTELLLYVADRIEHVNKVILPALEKGEFVVCDRFMDATVVYQGYARGLDIGMIQRLHREILPNVKPDLTLLFDLPVPVGLERAWKQIENGTRTGKETRFEKETLAFHDKIRAGYLDMAQREPDRFRIIDAVQDETAVTRDVIDCIDSILKQSR